MRVLIVGAGAIGAFLGHRLAAASHAVTLVARQSWADAIHTHGLGLEENGQAPLASNIAVVTDFQAAPDKTFDLVMCTTKAYDVAQAVRQVAPVIAEGVPLLLLQNGVGSEEIAARMQPQATCLSAVITLAVEVLSPGMVRLTTARGGMSLAAVSPSAPVADIAATLRQAGFARTSVHADYRAIKWSKLLLNILGNALPTILDMSPGEVFARRPLFDLERAAFREALAVMRELGIQPVSLPGYPVPLFAWAMDRLPGTMLHPLCRRLVIGGRGGKMPSLHLDLLKGKSDSEVDFLNGAVVAHAQARGWSVPANELLHSTLTAIVSGQTSWARFRRQPQELLSAWRAA